MRVLILSPYPSAILATCAAAGDEVFALDQPVSVPLLSRLQVQWIVSYGYRYIIRKPILDLYRARMINLHISLLPHNRGSDPNFWSWYDGSPKGVTIHQIDEGLDTGPILVQREIKFTDNETLASSYARLSSEIQDLFRVSWEAIRDGRLNPRPQLPGGSYHRKAAAAPIIRSLERGFSTPVRELVQLGEARRSAAGGGQMGTATPTKSTQYDMGVSNARSSPL